MLGTEGQGSRCESRTLKKKKKGVRHLTSSWFWEFLLLLLLFASYLLLRGEEEGKFITFFSISPLLAFVWVAQLITINDYVSSNRLPMSSECGADFTTLTRSRGPNLTEKVVKLRDLPPTHRNLFLFFSSFFFLPLLFLLTLAHDLFSITSC